MVFQDGFCSKCSEDYTDVYRKWCKSCQIDNLKGNFTNWTSGNERIDYFIRGMQLNIDKYSNIVFEWIPYNQFSDFKEIGRGGFATVYSAIWRDGPLIYNGNNKEYTRKSNVKVALKFLHNSLNITNEFLNEVRNLYKFELNKCKRNN